MMMRSLVVAAAVALLAAPVLADRAGLAHAHDVLRQIREIRAARADAQAAATVIPKFGHHVKVPPPVVDPGDGPDKEPEKAPDVKPSGTMRVRGQVRVVIGTATYAVGDEIENGWRAAAITAKKLTLRKGARSKDYTIP